MAQIALEEVLPILQSFVVTMRTDPIPSAADRLSEMGLDSLTTINVIVTAAESLGLDLEKLEEMTEAPATIGDIISILNRLGSLGIAGNTPGCCGLGARSSPGRENNW